MITVNGEQRKIGLALSGGGFRASIFHMGVIRRLSELELLDKIDVISTVSGGSIVGAYYVLNKDKWDNIKEIEAGFETGLKADLRGRGLTMSWAYHPLRFVKTLSSTYSRTNIMAEEYAKYFFGEKKLGELPNTPKLIINATSLNTGKIWKFQKELVGDDKFGFSPAPNFPIKNAVAASSAVPGVFAPLILNKRDLKEMKINPSYKNVNSVNLCDGGVRDNLGLTSVFDEKCDYILCSDASQQLEDTISPSKYAVSVLLRSYNITMNAVKNLEIQLFSQEANKVNKFRQIAFVNLVDHTDNGLPKTLVDQVVKIRTDLDNFSDDEIYTLIYHGYTLLDYRIKKYASDLLQGDIPPLKTEEFSKDQIKRLKNSLSN
ncbi:patatin-like phospholipase family protein [Candidatus Parabeggiatoa sp. HSG14]|uniref:patatin-like phospholipase family protein n=1 Tax=Candidatus Parabeggiatoa sp. HSG14 TaxID=3055593 RepID=UPI0025A89712|nr:patatin-like phospholipase family protein [Thiotrichales bacterium HSG14]